jgi:hypothetical protein
MLMQVILAATNGSRFLFEFRPGQRELGGELVARLTPGPVSLEERLLPGSKPAAVKPEPEPEPEPKPLSKREAKREAKRAAKQAEANKTDENDDVADEDGTKLFWGGVPEPT